MGQQRLSDLESVDFLCSHIRGWGEILAYPRHLVQRPEPVRVFGKSFNGELSLIWDRGKEDGSFAIEISLGFYAFVTVFYIVFGGRYFH